MLDFQSMRIDAKKWRRALKTGIGRRLYSPEGSCIRRTPGKGKRNEKWRETWGTKKSAGLSGRCPPMLGVFSTWTQFSLLEWGCQFLAHSRRMGLYSLRKITP